MQLDDLQKVWTAHGAALERSLAIDERLLRELLLGKVQRAMRPHLLWRAFEVALALAFVVLAAPLLVANLESPRYLLAIGALLVYLVVFVANGVRSLHAGARLDLGAPVTEMQRDLRQLQFAEFRALEWALFGGVVVWLPALLALFEAVTGVPALARVDLAWLLGNLAFGAVVLAAGRWWSRRFVRAEALRPWARRLVDAVSGRGLQTAARQLDELARFERQP